MYQIVLAGTTEDPFKNWVPYDEIPGGSEKDDFDPPFGPSPCTMAATIASTPSNDDKKHSQTIDFYSADAMYELPDEIRVLVTQEHELSAPLRA